MVLIMHLNINYKFTLIDAEGRLPGPMARTINMFDKKNILGKISSRKARRVFIQVPEGLKTRVLDLVAGLERHGIEAVTSIEPCYGGCDLLDREAKALGCDLLLHIGHSDYGLKTEVPVIYEEFFIEVDPTPFLKKTLDSLKPYSKISLVTTLQYIKSLDKARKFLESHGKVVFLGEPSLAKHPGQILGCDYSAAKPLEKLVDCFLFIGTGTFHPLGLSQEVEKPVLFLNLETGDLINLDKEKNTLERMRIINLERAKDSHIFGILVSGKPGQNRMKTAVKLKKILETKGKKAFILFANEITPEKLMGLKIECLVNTACPRIREDHKSFKKPIINPEDVGRI